MSGRELIYHAMQRLEDLDIKITDLNIMAYIRGMSKYEFTDLIKAYQIGFYHGKRGKDEV